MSETQEVIDKIRKMPPRNAEEALERIFLALADKLDAQEAELTRLREENERQRETLKEIAQARADQMAAWFLERDGLREEVATVTRERDEARAALEPFAQVGARYPTGGLHADLEQRSPDVFRLLHAHDFYQAAATLSRQSKEGGE